MLSLVWAGVGDGKERPVVRVRDLPLAGRAMVLRWRKRRYRCDACERTLPRRTRSCRARQHVSARFRGRLFERCQAARRTSRSPREERTTRYQVARVP